MTSSLLGILAHYRYAAIVPIAIAEGPIISVISGFLAAQGIVSFLPVFLIVFIGDFSSDAFFYFIGRRGREAAERWIPQLTEERLSIIEEEYKVSPWKTMCIAKLSYGLGIAFMIAAGLVRMTKKKFLIAMGALNAARSFILVTAGYYFGRLIIRTGDIYLARYTLLVIIIVPTTYFIVWKMRQKKKKTKVKPFKILNNKG